MSRITHVLGASGSGGDGDGEGPSRGNGVEPVRAIPWTIDDQQSRLSDEHGDSDWSSHHHDHLRRVTTLRDGSVVPPSDSDLLRYGAVLRRRWRLGAMIALVVAGGVAAGALLQTPMHRASGLLEIRHESTAPVASLFGSDRVAANDLETQFGILRSSSLAARVAEQLSEKEPRPRRGKPLLTTEAIQGGLRITPKTGSRLVEVSYASPDSPTAMAVVDSVLDNYLQFRMEEAKRSADWLGRQLREARGRLEASEARLQNFLRSHSLDVMETGKGETAEVVNERIQTLHKAFADAQADRIVRQSQAERAKQQSAQGDFDSPVLQSLTIKLADLRRDLARLSAVFHEDYPAVQAVTTQIGETERLIELESARIANRAERDYEASLRREDLIRQAIAQQDALVQRLGRGETGTGSYEALKREVVTNRAQYAALDQRLKEVSISAALRAANVGIVDRASMVPRPAGSSLPVVMILGIIVGLLAGGGGMFLKEHLDTSVRSVEDVGEHLGLPTLGAIPRLLLHDQRLTASNGALAEAFAALRTAVLLRDDTAASRVLLVTSANAGEGKTTVAVHLASSLARLNHRVLLIDANLRSPRLRDLFHLNGDKTLATVLTTTEDWRACVQGSVQRNLDVLAGELPNVSPADLVSLPQMRQLMTVVACEYDFVVMDSPAALAYPADVHALARFAGRVLLTVRQGVTRRKDIQLALSQIDHVSGVVLNGFHSRESSATRRNALNPA